MNAVRTQIAKRLDNCGKRWMDGGYVMIVFTKNMGITQ